MTKKTDPIVLKEPPRRPGDPVPPPEPIAEIELEPKRPDIPYETDTYDDNLARLDQVIHKTRRNRRAYHMRPRFTIFTVLGWMWSTRIGRNMLIVIGGLILFGALF
ncbi:hypothetical protein AAD018_010780 [Aestuariibius insulae]|uniref:hypothetical protein n=1 Tax=Aestuariibius insulae TaxID=2058287 RepID=UPI00345EF119